MALVGAAPFCPNAVSRTCVGSPNCRSSRHVYSLLISSARPLQQGSKTHLADVLRLGARLADLRLLVPHSSSGQPAEEGERAGADLALCAEVLLRHTDVSVSPSLSQFLRSRRERRDARVGTEARLAEDGEVGGLDPGFVEVAWRRVSTCDLEEAGGAHSWVASRASGWEVRRRCPRRRGGDWGRSGRDAEWGGREGSWLTSRWRQSSQLRVGSCLLFFFRSSFRYKNYSQLNYTPQQPLKLLRGRPQVKLFVAHRPHQFCSCHPEGKERTLSPAALALLGEVDERLGDIGRVDPRTLLARSHHLRHGRGVDEPCARAGKYA